MSRELIHEYFNDIDRLKKFSGTATEGMISEAFKDLLKGWARRRGLQFVAQYQFTSA